MQFLKACHVLQVMRMAAIQEKLAEKLLDKAEIEALPQAAAEDS